MVSPDRAGILQVKGKFHVSSHPHGKVSCQLPSSLSPKPSSLWMLKPRMWVLVLFFPNCLWRTTSSTPALSCHRSFLQPEQRHWLEGAGHPLTVWMDHKNLEYIQTAKHLNGRQARWAFFFNRFNFSLSYRPGSKNIKPDALSHLFDPDPTPRSPTSILPLSCVVGDVTWGIEEK